jgi:hypothetical protein
MAFALRQPMARRTATGRVADDDVDAPGSAAPRRAGRGRVAAARGAWAVGSGMLLVARIVRTIATLIALLIVAAIVLRVLDANATNSIVKDVHDGANFFASPFSSLFSLHNPKAHIAVNWGIAAVVYFAVGHFIASLIARMAPAGVAPGEAVA